MYLEYGKSPPFIERMNDDLIKIDFGYFINKTKIIVLLVQSIAYFKQKINKGNLVCFVDYKFISRYRKEITALINATPISSSEFTEYSKYTTHDISLLLRMYYTTLKFGITTANASFLLLLGKLGKHIEPTKEMFSESSSESELMIDSLVVMLSCYYSKENTYDEYESPELLIDDLNKALSSTNFPIKEVLLTMQTVFGLSFTTGNEILTALDTKGYINITEDMNITFDEQALSLLS